MFIDETWAKTNMTPIRGWSPRGSKLVAKAPFGKWKTLTFLAALRHDRIDAPCVLDGPINGERFTAYVTQFLVPTLSPGDVVIMDNLGSHKGAAVRKAIRAVGARLVFLPPYSPDLNPIEQVFAKLKLLLRKAAERTVEATWQRIGSLLDDFPPRECAYYLSNSGYASAYVETTLTFVLALFRRRFSEKWLFTGKKSLDACVDIAGVASSILATPTIFSLLKINRLFVRWMAV